MGDPYRTPAIVETREQRIDRLKRNYENIAIQNTPRDPVERAKALKQLDEAREKYWLAMRTP